MNILPREFFNRNAIEVAQDLLGKYVVRKYKSDILIGKIVETEAYLSSDDPASHSYIGKTFRNEILFGEAGHTYVHSIHRYHCMDIVTEGIGSPGAVLIRALEPIEGINVMKRFRHTETISNLTNGPGKLCQAFDITRKLNGMDTTLSTSDIIITSDNKKIDKDSIVNTQRVGITKAKEFKLRYFLKNSSFVSKK